MSPSFILVILLDPVSDFIFFVLNIENCHNFNLLLSSLTSSAAAAAKFLKYLKRSAAPLFCLFPLFAKSFPAKIEDEIENDILTRARRIRLTSYDRELCNRSFDSYLQNGFYCKVIFNRRFSLNTLLVAVS